VRDNLTGMVIELGPIKLRSRVLTSASLVGYGAPPQGARLVPYGMSPIARFLDLESFGAVTTRTITLERHEGHFTTRTDWKLREWPALVRRYGTALRRIDAGWLNAFGWANIGLDAYLRDYFPRTAGQNRILSVGGFTTEDFLTIVAAVAERIPTGAIAGVELNLSCHNVNLDFEPMVEEVLEGAVARTTHPLILKLSPDADYVATARLAERAGIAALTVINTVKGLRLDPSTGEPWLRNRYGGMSGRAIKPIGLRVVSELREAGVTLPLIATAGVRDFDDAREYYWAGADAVSLGSEAFLASPAGYLAAPLKAAALTRMRQRTDAWWPAAPAWAAVTPTAPAVRATA
jgi:dihydroorotate dehydrogenase (NAD+) catalytic subunit